MSQRVISEEMCACGCEHCCASIPGALGGTPTKLWIMCSRRNAPLGHDTHMSRFMVANIARRRSTEAGPRETSSVACDSRRAVTPVLPVRGNPLSCVRDLQGRRFGCSCQPGAADPGLAYHVLKQIPTTSLHLIIDAPFCW